MTWVYVLSKKSDVAETVKTDWLPMVEQQQDRLVKAIRTDQGGEFLSKEFSLWQKKNGIRHSLTMPYSPAMNGIAEQANRTITETARGLLIEAGLPDYFWPNAVRKGFDDGSGRVLKLKKALYGLKQAPRQWYLKLRGVLEEIGFTPSTADHSLFMLGEGEQRSFMVVYVDDILIFSPSSDLVKEVMLKLQDKFKCTALGDVSFYLGLHIERDVEKRCMRVHQRKYLEALAANFGQSEGHVATTFPSGFKCVKEPEEESVGEDERRRFHSLVGSLMYAAVNTRPDVAFANGQLAKVVECPNEEQIAARMRMAKYLGQTLTVGLQYSAAAQRRQKGADGVEPGRLFLTAFSDASYASEPEDMTSVGGFICCVSAGPTAWESKNQVDKALSSVESEYMALFRAVAAGMRVAKYLGQTPTVRLQYSEAAQRRQKGADGVEPGRLFLTAFSDASYASEPEDMTSVGGFICCVSAGPTAWESKNQVDKALSSVESEYMALFRAVREIVWQWRLLAEMGEEQQGPTPLYCDSQGAIALAKNPVLHGLTKHMRVKWHWTRSMVAACELEVNYVKTTRQPADMMTKRMVEQQHWNMTPRADLLTELEPSPVKHVTSALGQRAEVKGMGKAMFKGADGKMVGLKNVLWVPNLAANLISVRRLQKAGMDTSSKGAKTYTARLGERILWDLHGDRDVYNEMWQIPVVPMPKEKQVAASISTKGEAVGSGDGANGRTKEIESKKCNLGGTNKLGEHKESGAAAKKQHKGEENPKAAADEKYGETMWGTIVSAAFSNPTSATGECDWLTLHRRMGHVALPILQQLVKNEIVAGIRVKGEPDEVLGCPTCMQAKFTRYPFSSSEATAKAPLDEVVMDVVGPLKLGAAGKSDVAETVKTDWLPMMEQQQDRLVKAIRTDRGGEFLSKEFSLWLKKNGIRHSLTMPYSPAMNGIAEQANRTITETARGLLIEAGLPDYFWPDAVRKGFDDGSGRVLKLKKALYGLKQAPRQWYLKLRGVLEEIGFTPSTADHSLFMLGEGEQRSFMVVYVDDILIFSPSSDLVKEVMLKLQDKFKCTALGDVSFYLGLHIERDVEKRCMRVHQRKYLEALAANFGQSEGHVATTFPSGFKCVKEPEEECVGEDQRRHSHSLVGSLMYAAVNTRPDVAFANGQLARVVECPNEEQVAARMRVAKYLGQTLTVGLQYSAAAQRRQKGADGVEPGRLFLTAFSDASYASEPEDMTSAGGFICCVSGGPTAWESKNQVDQALSSVESEYMALFRAVREIVWQRRLLAEMGEEQQGPTPLYCDSQGAIALAKNPVLHGLTKHLRVKWHWTRSMVAACELGLHYVKTTRQPADMMTKRLVEQQHWKCCKLAWMAMN
ncbi:unnamed protein product [Closterium sp. NIES-54]